MASVYRIWPGNDAFEINGVLLPYVDLIADDEDSAVRAAYKLMPDLNATEWGNCGLQGYQKAELIDTF